MGPGAADEPGSRHKDAGPARIAAGRGRRPFGIFISYRRDDSAGHAGRLFDKLADRFGGRRVFMDVNAIQPGMDFRTAIDRALGSSSVVLAVIGKRWLDASSADGIRRLDEPNDLVRLEISSALRQGMDVIPVLVQRASLPAAAQLPEDIRALKGRHAIEIDDARWDLDVVRLIHAIERSGVARPAPPWRRPIGLVAALAIVVATGVVALLLGSGSGPARPAASAPASASPSTLLSVAAASPVVPGTPRAATPSFGSLLFSDPLTGPVSGLPAGTTANCAVAVANGLAITARGAGRFCAADTALVDRAITSLQDVSVEVDATFSAFTTTNSPFGPGDAAIVCRLVGGTLDGSFYVASLSPSGYWDVDRFVHGAQQRLDSGHDPQLVTPQGTARHLRFDCAGLPGEPTSISFSVDSLSISAVQDPNGLARGSVALGVTAYADPKIEAAFHQLVIRGP